jgi:hypothetical protein
VTRRPLLRLDSTEVVEDERQLAGVGKPPLVPRARLQRLRVPGAPPRSEPVAEVPGPIEVAGQSRR